MRYGELNIVEPKIFVGDPMCKTDQPFNVWEIQNLKIGSYNCYTESQEYIGTGEKYVSIAIVNKDDEEHISNPRFANQYNHIFGKNILTNSGYIGFVSGPIKSHRCKRKELEQEIIQTKLFDYYNSIYFCVPALFMGKKFYTVMLTLDRYKRVVKVDINFLKNV